MDRKLAHIEKIVSIRPIDGADRIECATVLGWECVIGKGEYNVGDKIIYIEVDSILPEKPEYEFLAERHYRIKIAEFRKQVSQGLIRPLSDLPKGFLPLKVGTDVTDALGIVKYEHPQEKIVQGGTSRFPSWISKTDEERIQNMPRVLDEDALFEVTEKLDGQSATYFLRKTTGWWATIRSWFGKGSYEFGVCSRNLRLYTHNSSSYWKIAKEYNIEKVLTDIIEDADHIILQGEIVGSGIQGNKYGLDGLEFYVFNLTRSDLGKLSASSMIPLLFEHGIRVVPLITGGFRLPNTLQEVLDYAEGMSSLAHVKREGLVFRNKEREISFKAISPKFLLKHKD